MEGIMVEFILWTDNPKTDIDKISHYIGTQPIEKKRMGEMRYIGPNKNIEKINEESSLLYSTDYIKTVEVEHAMPKMIDMLKPNMKNIISVINQYKLHAKFCVVVDLPEKPIIYFSSDVIKAMAQLSAEIEFDMYIG